MLSTQGTENSGWIARTTSTALWHTARAFDSFDELLFALAVTDDLARAALHLEFLFRSVDEAYACGLRDDGHALWVPL